MGIKSWLSKPYARHIAAKVRKRAAQPLNMQTDVLNDLIHKGKNTSFGHDHRLEEVMCFEDLRERVPIRDYEGLRPYIDRVVAGEEDILWPGKPIYLAKTAGTTSGSKYIPISKESMPNHITSTRNALLCYIAETGRSDFVNGKMIFLQGSPEVEEVNGIPTGRLSGIVAHHVPRYLLKNRMPSFTTNCIDDWEEKLEAVIDETLNEDMTLISGIPSWVQMYFERLQERTGGKKIREIFPNFSLMVYGGVNFEPYRQHFRELIGKKMDGIEVYPASEGFLAFQDSQEEEGMLLMVDSGIFYEFIPADEVFNENPTRLWLKDVELDVNYAVILHTSAGLWGYSIGDTVKFVSRDPYRIIVTGRIKHFTSAFGEHVIAEEVEQSLRQGVEQTDAEVIEFTVAPQMDVSDHERPYHEWFIEFARKPSNMEELRARIDAVMQEQNPYYKDLIEGGILQPLRIRSVERGGFTRYMKDEGKLGGQNKVPRLADDRHIADKLVHYAEREGLEQ